MKKEQADICPLCGGPLGDDIVLDHDHKTGDVRAVLHRWCNAVLGKIENWSYRVGQGVESQDFLRNTLDYLRVHRENPSNLKYPTYKTEDEKRLARNKKARVARRKAKEAD
jgi:hypothetical protein